MACCVQNEQFNEKENDNNKEEFLSYFDNFSFDEPNKKEQEKTEDGVQPAKESECPAVPEKKGFVKRTVSRFRTGRWGEWKDLITEMDEGGV